MIITVVGGGSSAHVLIPFISNTFKAVNLLTRRPELWSREVRAKYKGPEGEIRGEYSGQITLASSLPEDVIPQADIIILCLPVSKYRPVLHRIAPHISQERDVFLGTIYGQGGFNWMFQEVKSRFELLHTTYFAIGLIPWICRTVQYGQEGVTFGPKSVNVVAVSPRNRFSYLNEVFLRASCECVFGKGGFLLADNFFSLTLSVDNQIIHPSRCLGLYLSSGGSWDKKEDVPLFYRDYDKLSADLLKELDADYSVLRESVKSKYSNTLFTYMLDYLALERLSYGSCNSDILASFVASQTLGAIRTPVVRAPGGRWVLDKSSRFFSDDIYYGLCIAKWIAEKLNVEVPTIDRILGWAQSLLNDEILCQRRLVEKNEDTGGKFKTGVPSVYGFTTVDDIIDDLEV